jgi:hypothetical protein
MVHIEIMKVLNLGSNTFHRFFIEYILLHDQTDLIAMFRLCSSKNVWYVDARCDNHAVITQMFV